MPSKPVTLPRTFEPKTVEELLKVNNATKHLQRLLESGYDDIKYIYETSDDELKDIGIVDKADRDQVNSIHGIILIIAHCAF